jgi:hypothetical protein
MESGVRRVAGNSKCEFEAFYGSSHGQALAPNSDRGRHFAADSGTRGETRQRDGRKDVARRVSEESPQVASAQRKTDALSQKRRPHLSVPLTGAMGRTGLEPVTSCVSNGFCQIAEKPETLVNHFNNRL